MTVLERPFARLKTDGLAVTVERKKPLYIMLDGDIAQTLGAKISPGIDHVIAFGRFQIDRGTGAIVARIARTADSAVAANHGHALRRASPEKG